MNGLAAVMDRAAVDAAATRLERGGGVDYEVGGEVVASLGPAGAEFHLGPDVGAAALGTPDTQVSARGAGWVVFRPRTIDRFALDRAAAWLGFAARVSLRR